MNTPGSSDSHSPYHIYRLSVYIHYGRIFSDRHCTLIIIISISVYMILQSHGFMLMYSLLYKE